MTNKLKTDEFEKLQKIQSLFRNLPSEEDLKTKSGKKYIKHIADQLIDHPDFQKYLD